MAPSIIALCGRSSEGLGQALRQCAVRPVLTSCVDVAYECALHGKMNPFPFRDKKAGGLAAPLLHFPALCENTPDVHREIGAFAGFHRPTAMALLPLDERRHCM